MIDDYGESFTDNAPTSLKIFSPEMVRKALQYALHVCTDDSLEDILIKELFKEEENSRTTTDKE